MIDRNARTMFPMHWFGWLGFYERQLSNAQAWQGMGPWGPDGFLKSRRILV